ncbi:MAG TPA: polysaccharide deacetylase family protein [Solirubrobacteraceae bacterium]|nr:polysaccharide deacetylase family protein [Solirubrobacteraceae bacterium]
MSRGAEKGAWRVAGITAAAATALAVIAGLGAAVAHGGSLVSTGQPLSVAGSSLSQSGQQLVWKLMLTAPFSPAALRPDGRTLCLLIERVRTGGITGQLCVVGPRPGRRSPRLVYAGVTDGVAGRERAIAATISRPSIRSLTASFLPGQIDNSYRTVSWQVRNTLRSSLCTSPPAGGWPCTSLYPTRPAITKLHTPRLVGCVPKGSSLVYSGSASRHEVALTFDDGPWYQPPATQFVDLLARYHVPATFFEIGRQLSTYDRTGSAQRKMLANGDMIGDHTWSHPDMVGLSRSAQRSQLERTAAAIRRATGFTPCLWRPPYGAVNRSLIAEARSLGFLTVQWDVDPVDWSTPGTATIYQRVVGAAHNGAIILQHFGGGPRYQTYDALPDEIRTLRSRGYRFVTVAQMLGLRLVYR